MQPHYVYDAALRHCSGEKREVVYFVDNLLAAYDSIYVDGLILKLRKLAKPGNFLLATLVLFYSEHQGILKRSPFVISFRRYRGASGGGPEPNSFYNIYI